MPPGGCQAIGPLEADLRRLYRILSAGIRKWVDLLFSLTEAGWNREKAVGWYYFTENQNTGRGYRHW